MHLPTQLLTLSRSMDPADTKLKSLIFQTLLTHSTFKRRCDYWRLYSGVGDTYHEGSVDIYDFYGISKSEGVILVIRPDSHVAQVSQYSIDGLKEVDNYFNNFMIPQTNNVLPTKTSDINDSKRFIQPRLAV